MVVCYRFLNNSFYFGIVILDCLHFVIKALKWWHIYQMKHFFGFIFQDFKKLNRVQLFLDALQHNQMFSHFISAEYFMWKFHVKTLMLCFFLISTALIVFYCHENKNYKNSFCNYFYPVIFGSKNKKSTMTFLIIFNFKIIKNILSFLNNDIWGVNCSRCAVRSINISLAQTIKEILIFIVWH